MAFPDQPLGLKGELRMGSAWQDITGDLYTRDAITHTRGRPYKSNAADPAACAATIRNLDGTYTPATPRADTSACSTATPPSATPCPVAPSAWKCPAPPTAPPPPM